MGKDKLKRFAEMQTFERVIQPEINYHSPDFNLKGKWNETIFQKPQPIVLEIGCGKGEYTVALAQRYPQKNFIGIDIKGARIWRGAKTINEEKIMNAAFLRIRMETIEKFFAANEISEIWITFPDPQPKESKENKRLTSPLFLKRYSTFLKPNGIVHLKTDNKSLFEFTVQTVSDGGYKILNRTTDLYQELQMPVDMDIQTTYEKKYLAAKQPIFYLSFQLNKADKL
ncbi:MAG: tRNA (guanosine(46)-N7)-methyltransferase TrmB [Bacteroidia bacterium]